MVKEPDFITGIFWDDLKIEEGCPEVTLTFAQSLDAKIAGVGGKQLMLSSRESMEITHW